MMYLFGVGAGTSVGFFAMTQIMYGGCSLWGLVTAFAFMGAGAFIGYAFFGDVSDKGSTT